MRVGNSVLHYPEWEGSFYPADMKPAKMLPLLRRAVLTVEINATFYRCDADDGGGLGQSSSPDAFTFVLKAAAADHPLRAPPERRRPVRFFCDTARLLRARLGPLFFQLPPNFKKDVSRLGDLLVQLPPELRAAFEFRHASWFADDVYDRLGTRNAALCIADTEEGSTPPVATADWGYVRLRAVEYTDAQLAEWVTIMRRIGHGWRDAFVFFKHEDQGTGPALAKRFEALSRE